MIPMFLHSHKNFDTRELGNIAVKTLCPINECYFNTNLGVNLAPRICELDGRC